MLSIFDAFSRYLHEERGLAPKSIIRHLPVIRRFLREVCPRGTRDLGRISQEDVTRYVERHARDVLVAARISPIPSSQRAEPVRSGQLRALHQAMEAREPADISVCFAGAQGPRWL